MLNYKHNNAKRFFVYLELFSAVSLANGFPDDAT